jgi:tRNA uridine 5-carbamoylmethylation protein Kti12
MDEGMGTSMKMPKVAFILVGVSGSGKSTVLKYMRTIAGEGTQAVFSLDESRLRLASNAIAAVFERTGDMSDKEAYRIAFEVANDRPEEFNAQVNKDWAEALKADIVFVDNTNLTRKSRARWINDLRAKKFSISGVNVIAPLQVVLDRQATRGDKIVPEEVVRNMYMSQQEMLLGDEVDFLFHVDGTQPLHMQSVFHI